MQSKKYQCLNINVITLVVYATNNKFMYYGQKSSKKPPTKIHGKNLLKIPCGQKSSKG
jgi:hypothetical protein